MKVFNSNIKKQNKIVVPTDITKILGTSFTDKLINDAKEQAQLFSGSYTSVENYDYETSFDSRLKTTFNSKTKINYIPKIVRPEKDYVLDFRREQQDITANWIFRKVDIIEILNSETVKLILTNVLLQPGIDTNENNFEIYINGVKTPVIYYVIQNEQNVEIILQEFIGVDNVNKDRTNIYVKGKIINQLLTTQDDIQLLTEDGLDLIL